MIESDLGKNCVGCLYGGGFGGEVKTPYSLVIICWTQERCAGVIRRTVKKKF